ncbi:MAG: ketopantoate reductase family protein [Syntrophomonas sp.]
MINKVSIVGLGAIGCAYMNQIVKTIPIENLSVIADGERARRYSENEITINGENFRFKVVRPAEKCDPVDLLIFGVKFHQLEEAIEEVINQVGPNTIILSLLNGITSEEIIGARFGMEKVLYSVNAGIDALKVGNEAISHHLGTTYFGEKVNKPGSYSEKVLKVQEFFERTGIHYIIPEDMMNTLWWKFMLNVGVNQTSAVLRVPYGIVQDINEVQELMVDAMREVVEVSQKAGINLSQEDINECLRIIKGLEPSGKTSMCQDMEAARQTEVNIFAGTVVELGKKYGVSTPVNGMLMRIIKASEAIFRYNATIAKD